MVPDVDGLYELLLMTPPHLRKDDGIWRLATERVRFYVGELNRIPDSDTAYEPGMTGSELGMRLEGEAARAKVLYKKIEALENLFGFKIKKN